MKKTRKGLPLTRFSRYCSNVKDYWFWIDSMTTFQDLRTGEEEDGGDQQTLLVWITNGKAMNEIISTLQQISEELPYG
jgi:hypothetical protein